MRERREKFLFVLYLYVMLEEKICNNVFLKNDES